MQDEDYCCLWTPAQNCRHHFSATWSLPNSLRILKAIYRNAGRPSAIRCDHGAELTFTRFGTPGEGLPQKGLQRSQNGIVEQE